MNIKCGCPFLLHPVVINNGCPCTVDWQSRAIKANQPCVQIFISCKILDGLATYLFSILHCYHQRKIRWLERDLNSHFRVSRPPLYPLSYRVNGDWWRVLSNLSGRKYSRHDLTLVFLRTRSVSILFQNHPQRYEKLICFQSYTATTNEKFVGSSGNSHLRVFELAPSGFLTR